ncbi:MAG: hypothetical protein V4622_09715 [Bacteroidota bacterium]
MANSQTLDWNFIHPVKKTSIHFGEKGSVQEKLIEIGELPDPFYGENEKLFTWIENYDWEFFSEFELASHDFEHEFIEINFPVVDTYSKIYLNGKLIAQTDNAFHPYSLQIKQNAVIGKNSLRVVFQSPINYHKKAYHKRHSKLPAPNDVGKIAVASMSRKPQYQFGWDWALRMNTIGFWKKVEILKYSSNRLVQTKIETISLEENQANLILKAYLLLEKNQTYTIESKLFGRFENIQQKGNSLSIPVSLKNPRLWWPRGQGEQFLYEDEITVLDKDRELVSTQKVKFGVRTSELIQEKDQWGTSFYFKINGRSIFCKGANFIPQEVFPSKITNESTINLIEQMRKSNFNMVRVWGGGFYPDDIFYETCDEKGILVWQDLMFACAMYPGDETFMSSVSKELNFQIPRISAHPSVIYFNGNNEVDVAWKNWAFQIRYRIGPRMQKQIEKDYVHLFQIIAPNIIKSHTNLPYIHTSPLSNWGKDEYFNHGTMHYWGVWHGKDPMEDFGLKSGRFNAEYGFQSFPEYASLKAFSEEKDWDLNSSVMKHHQKSYVGNGMIKKHSDNLFGSTDDFKEFIYFSQLTQAKAVGIAISGHRLDAPRSMGTLYWQLNDCWSAPTWSSIDYYNNWKALQYQVKNDFEDLGIIEQTKKIGEEKYFLISDVPDTFSCQVNYQFFDLQGNLLLEESEKIAVNGKFSQEIALKSQEENLKSKNYILKLAWNNDLGEQKSRTFFHEKMKYEKAKTEEVSFELIEINESSKTAKIKLINSKFIANCWVFSNQNGISFNTNFEHYLPGEHFIEIKFEHVPKQEDFGIIWR